VRGRPTGADVTARVSENVSTWLADGALSPSCVTRRRRETPTTTTRTMTRTRTAKPNQTKSLRLSENPTTNSPRAPHRSSHGWGRAAPRRDRTVDDRVPVATISIPSVPIGAPGGINWGPNVPQSPPNGSHERREPLQRGRDGARAAPDPMAIALTATAATDVRTDLARFNYNCRYLCADFARRC
jgi:hypothetical protein